MENYYITLLAKYACETENESDLIKVKHLLDLSMIEKGNGRKIFENYPKINISIIKNRQINE